MKNTTLQKFFIVDFPRYSLLGFLLCVIAAMYLYPGGIYHYELGIREACAEVCTKEGHHTEGYLFFKNFLSDLGRTISHGGHNNFHSSLLFNMALSFACLTYIIFFSFIKNLFPGKTIAKIGSLFGVCGALSLLGVALTPADLYLKPHIIANHWIFRFFLLSTIIYSWLIYKEDRVDNKYLIGNIIFIISLVTYILILIWGPMPTEPGGLEVQAVAQKIIMFNFVGSIFIQTMAFNKMLEN